MTWHLHFDMSPFGVPSPGPVLGIWPGLKSQNVREDRYSGHDFVS
jgi:hypothetical protein